MKPKIAFVGHYKYNCGASNALLGYLKAGKQISCDIRVSKFSHIDKAIQKNIPTAEKNWQPDLFIISYESYSFLTKQNLDLICKTIPRKKRIIIDSDAKYSPLLSKNGDSNHLDNKSFKYWQSLYDSLSDIVLQPIIKSEKNSKIKSFLYFGMDKHLNKIPKIKKEFELLYVGNNWHRWSDMKSLIMGLKNYRSVVKNIAIIGKWWDKETASGFESVTKSNSQFLEKNNIKLFKSAPYGQVELSMSRGLLNPILIRPILNSLKLITPRMFETFVANTVPLIPSYFTHATKLYGSEISKFIISKNSGNDIEKIIKNYKKYNLIAAKIREELFSKHSYEVRIKELFKFA